MVATFPELVELVEYPVETLAMELKSWVDWSSNLVRAKMAKHLCALANNGGGHLLIGFNDNGTPNESEANDLNVYNRDTVTSIIDKYLVPAFQCDVVVVRRESDGKSGVVVRVPSHGATPICAKCSGPHDLKGKPQGIIAGTHYTRVPGPKSVPVDSPLLWGPIIRRCVLREKESLLGSIANIVSSVDQSIDQKEPILDQWHKSTERRYYELVSNSSLNWPFLLADNHYHFSYILNFNSSETVIELDQFKEIVQQVSEEVKNNIWTGWSMFYSFRRPEIAPYVMVDETKSLANEMLESSLLNDSHSSNTLPDFWRLAVDGRASIIRPYREDRVLIDTVENYPDAVKTFSPRMLVRELFELICHAKALANHYPRATSIQFRLAWVGLNNRKIADSSPGVYWHDRICRNDRRTINGLATPEELASESSRIVAGLANQVLVLFDGLTIQPNWVDEILPEFHL